MKTSVLPLESRLSATALLERIDKLIPKAATCREDVPKVNQLIERRNALAHNRDLGEEYKQLCAEIESRFQDFKTVDQEIRAVVSALRDWMDRLPQERDDVQRLRHGVERLALLGAVECSLQVNKDLAVRDLALIRVQLNELVGQRTRPSPAEVVDERRATLGFTIEALAEKAGVNRKQIYAIKKGGNVKAETLRSVAAALECEPGDLIQPAANPPSKTASTA